MRPRVISACVLVAAAIGLAGWWMSVSIPKRYVPQIPEAKEHESRPMPQIDPDRA